MQAAIFGLGPVELIIIIVVAIAFFLPAVLPKIARRLMDTLGTVRSMTEQAHEGGEGEGDDKPKKEDSAGKE